MTKINAQQFTLEYPYLRIDTTNMPAIDIDCSACFITGDNGLGKTKFIEEGLIPYLRSKNISYIFIGQDISIQSYTIRATLGVLSKDTKGKNLMSIINDWIISIGQAHILILDEVDKYFFNDYSIIKNAIDQVKSYFIVSHNLSPELLNKNNFDCRSGFLFEFIKLDDSNQIGKTKNVKIKAKKIW